MSLDKNLLIWLPLTKNTKNRGSKYVHTKVEGDLTFDSAHDALAPFPSRVYFNYKRMDNIDVSFTKKMNFNDFTISWWEKPKTTVSRLDSLTLNFELGNYITLYKTDKCRLYFISENALMEIFFLDDKGDEVTILCDGNWHFYALTYKYIKRDY